jgi:hypothetical protein
LEARFQRLLPHLVESFCRIRVNSPGVESVLQSHAVESLRLVFPNFTSITSIVSRTGETVLLPNLSNCYALSLPDGGSQELLSADLSAELDVLFATPDHIVAADLDLKQAHAEDILAAVLGRIGECRVSRATLDL